METIDFQLRVFRCCGDLYGNSPEIGHPVVQKERYKKNLLVNREENVSSRLGAE
jgi:hypothetical protein